MKSKYYNGVRILNANCPINLSIGNRSTGKSYYWKRYCMKQFKKHGRQFIYMRRFDNELEFSLKKFFDDISHEFPDCIFEYVSVKIGYELKLKVYNSQTKDYDNYICGYGVSLNTIHKVKSMPFSKVDTIFYDEFIPDNQRYLKPSVPSYEPELLLSLYLTVARGHNEVIRDYVKIICVGNSITYYNPYFSFFNIDLSTHEHGKFYGGEVYAERVYNQEVADEIRNSKIGTILSRSGYGSMALDNKGMYDTDAHIAKRPKSAIQGFALFFGEWFTFWLDIESDNIHVSQSYDSTLKKRFKLCEMNDGEQIPWLDKYRIDMLRNMSSADKIYYDNGKIKARLHGLFIPKII